VADFVALLANPTAGRGRAGRLIEPATAALRAAGLDVRLLTGASAAESVSLGTAAVADGAAALIALGGDGLVHWAVQAVAGTPVPLAIIPAGTGNDMATVLGVPDLPALAAALSAGTYTEIDAGRVDGHADGHAGGRDRWWLGVLCAGFDSAVNERANRMRWPRGPRRYDLAILAELSALRPRPMVLTLDGERHEREVTLVAVGNGPQYGGGKRISPDAALDDGLFDVTIVAPVSRRTLVRLTPSLPTGGHLSHPAVEVVRARTVELSAPGVIAYADGERVAPLPVTTRCEPKAVRIVG
jgi:diacylglycerol kinase (ATP)